MQITHKYLSNLTPLRGIAAIWVVVYHFSEMVAKFVPTDRSLLLTKGYLMVDLFFIMSGFIIYHVYQQSFQSGITSGNFRQFFVARFARIYPLHFFTLLILVLMALARGTWFPIQSPAAIPTNLLLIHSFGIHDIFTWNVPSWSISAEWWAYMVFPALVIFLSRKKNLAVGILGLFVILAYLAIMYWIKRVNFFNPSAPSPQDLNVTYDYGYLRGLAGFISGMLLYKAYEAGIARKIFQKDITAIIIILATFFCMHFGLNDAFDIVFFALIVFAFALNNEKVHAICNIRAAQWVGKISYSIYLVQLFPVIPIFAGLIKLPGLVYGKYSATTGFWTGVGYCSIYLLLVIGLSTLTYYTIEKPCRIFINRKWGKEKMPVYA